MDPSLGRFLARDPIGYVDGMNLYQGYFVHGGVDPTGLKVMVVEDGTGTDWVPDGSRTIPWPDRDSAPMAGRRDWLDVFADVGTGYNDFLLFGANRWLQFEGDMTDEDGIAYKSGYRTGIGAGVVLTGGMAGAARGGAQLATQITRTYSAISRLQGMGESAHNIYTGEATVLDFLSFLTPGARRGARPSHVLGFADEAENVARRAPTRVANGTADALSGARLNRHLTQLEEYGSAGYKELQNGRFRYYGNVNSASKPGTIAGRRVVREWDPSTNNTRTWMENLDHQGRIRIVRPETCGPKVHYQFDEQGNFKGSF